MRITSIQKLLSNWFWRFVPITLLVGFITHGLAKEIVRPQHRWVKASVAAGVLLLMFRFEMIYSIYLFVFLLPYPSSISIGSTNSILITLIVLTWFIRAQSGKMTLFYRTDIDKYIVLFMGAYIVSLFNVDEFSIIKRALTDVIYKQLTAILFFYLIVRLVTDEEKLFKFTRIVAFSAGLIFFTGMIELFFPSATIIPGWISLKGERYSGATQALRVGGAIGEEMISDFTVIMIILIGYHFIYAKNPFMKFVWFSTGLMAFINVLATANRGATFTLLLGLTYLLYIFRKKFSFVKSVSLVVIYISLFVVGNLFLERYTIAVSVIDRIVGTEFEGIMPDTRQAAWEGALVRSTDHIIIGHGPLYEYGPSLDLPTLWPHNAYIFYLYTLGILGLSVFLLIVYKLLKISLLFKKKLIWDTPLGTLMAIFHIQLIMFLFLQLRTDHQRAHVYMYIVWLLFALITAAARIIRKKEEEEFSLESGA